MYQENPNTKDQRNNGKQNKDKTKTKEQSKYKSYFTYFPLSFISWGKDERQWVVEVRLEGEGERDAGWREGAPRNNASTCTAVIAPEGNVHGKTAHTMPGKMKKSIKTCLKEMYSRFRSYICLSLYKKIYIIKNSDKKFPTDLLPYIQVYDISSLKELFTLKVLLNLHQGKSSDHSRVSQMCGGRRVTRWAVWSLQGKQCGGNEKLVSMWEGFRRISVLWSPSRDL